MLVLLLILGYMGSISSQANGKPMPMNVTMNVHSICRNCTQATSGELENDLEFDASQMETVTARFLELDETIATFKAEVEGKIMELNTTFTSQLVELNMEIKNILAVLQKSVKGNSIPAVKPKLEEDLETQPSLERKGKSTPSINIQILSPDFGLSFGDLLHGGREAPIPSNSTFLEDLGIFSGTCAKLLIYILIINLLIFGVLVMLMYLALSIKVVWERIGL